MKHPGRRQLSLPGSGILTRSLLVAVGSLSALQATGETSAMSAGENARWQAETVYQFSIRADFASSQGQVTQRDAIVGTAHVRFASPAEPSTAGLMIEYGFIDDQEDALLVAGMYTYKMSKWTAAASLFYRSGAQPASGDWHYWGSVRRRVARRHSLGIELSGGFETGRPAKWMLCYRAEITETLSVGVAAGSGFDAGPDSVARTSVIWRPRPGRR